MIEVMQINIRGKVIGDSKVLDLLKGPSSGLETLMEVRTKKRPFLDCEFGKVERIAEPKASDWHFIF